MICTGYLSFKPVYTVMQPDQTEIKLVVRRSGKLIGACQPVSAAELEQTPSNMRLPMICPREKSPIRVELFDNGLAIFAETLIPSGLHNDGVITAYKSVIRDSGPAEFQLKIKANPNSDSYSETHDLSLVLSSEYSLVLYYDDTGFHYSAPASQPNEVDASKRQDS
jgi:hypothetical protein